MLIKFQKFKVLFKYSCGLIAAKLKVYPQFWVPLSLQSIRLFISSLPPRRNNRLRVTLSRLPGRCQIFLDCLHPHLLIHPLAESPYRQALSLSPHILSSSVDTTNSGVNLT